MSQVTMNTTTQPVTFMCTSASPFTMTVTMGSTAVDLGALGHHGVHTAVDHAVLGQHDVVLLLTLGGFCWSHHCATDGKTSVPHVFSSLCQLYHGSSSG